MGHRFVAIPDFFFAGAPTEGLISYTIEEDLKCLHDNGYQYIWRARADDGEVNGSWSVDFTFNLTAVVALKLNTASINFGSLDLLVTNDTDNGAPDPIVVENNGTVLVNISLNSSALWDSIGGNSSNYQFKADNVTGEEDSFDVPNSIIAFFSVPINAYVTAISQLNYSDAVDSAEIDINVTVPGGERAGAKSANLVVQAELGE